MQQNLLKATCKHFPDFRKNCCTNKHEYGKVAQNNFVLQTKDLHLYRWTTMSDGVWCICNLSCES